MSDSDSEGKTQRPINSVGRTCETPLEKLKRLRDEHNEARLKFDKKQRKLGKGYTPKEDANLDITKGPVIWAEGLTVSLSKDPQKKEKLVKVPKKKKGKLLVQPEYIDGEFINPKYEGCEVCPIVKKSLETYDIGDNFRCSKCEERYMEEDESKKDSEKEKTIKKKDKKEKKYPDEEDSKKEEPKEKVEKVEKKRKSSSDKTKKAEKLKKIKNLKERHKKSKVLD